MTEKVGKVMGRGDIIGSDVETCFLLALSQIFSDPKFCVSANSSPPTAEPRPKQPPRPATGRNPASPRGSAPFQASGGAGLPGAIGVARAGWRSRRKHKKKTRVLSKFKGIDRRPERARGTIAAAQPGRRPISRRSTHTRSSSRLTCSSWTAGAPGAVAPGGKPIGCRSQTWLCFFLSLCAKSLA